MLKRLTGHLFVLALTSPAAAEVGRTGIGGNFTATPIDVPAQASQCAIEICGDPRSYRNLREMIESRRVVDPAVRREFNKKIKPTLETWFAESVVHARRQLEMEDVAEADDTVDRGLSRSLKAPLSANEIAINNLVWTLSHKRFDELVARALFNSGERAVLDRAKAFALLAEMNPEERNYLIAFTEIIANIPEFGELTFLRTASFANMLELKYPYRTLQEAAQLDGRRYLNMQNHLLAVDPSLNFLSWITKRNIRNMAEGKEVVLNAETQTRLGKARLNLALYDGVLTPGPMRELFLMRPVPYDPGKIDRAFKSLLARVRSTIADQATLRVKKENLMEECLKAYNFSQLAAPDETELKKIGVRIESIKNSAVEVAGEYAGPEAASYVRAAVQSSEFRLPGQNSVIGAVWAGAMNEMMESDRRDADEANRAMARSLRYNLELIEELDGNATFYNIVSLCANLQPQSLSDHALTTLGRVSLSWPTVKYPDLGTGIVAHEIGHIVSAAIGIVPSPRYRKVRQCAMARHMVAPEFNIFSGALYGEEDWADTFAAHVIKRLNGAVSAVADGTAKNFACFMIDKDGAAYGSDKSPLSLLNPNPSDPHSADFFRVIQVQLEMGELPLSCRQTVASLGNRNFKACGNSEP